MADLQRRIVLSRADSRSEAPSVPWQRIESASTSQLPEDLDGVCVILDDDIERDEFVALVSVLAVRGVRAFETSQATVVQRILDTHAAISAGEIEVLER